MNTFEMAKNLFLDGLEYFKNQEFQDAEHSFLKSLTFAPNRASTLNNLAATQIKLKKFDDAEKNLRQVIGIDENSIDLWLNLGIIYFERRELAQAISYLERCVDLDLNNILAWKLIAQAHDYNKEFNRAIICFKKILELNPNDLDALIGIGAILNDLKEYDASIRYHQLAIDINPNFTGGYVNMGVALSGLAKYDLGLYNYSIALELDPKDSETWSNKGNALHELKRFNEALVHHDKALILKPEYAAGWSNKGNTLHELKRYDEALAHYDKSLTLKPDYTQAWLNKGVTLHELKRYDEALAHYDKSLTLKPDYAEAWSNKGVTLNELKRYDEAITHYDRALSLKIDIDWASGNLLHTKMKICNWLGLPESLAVISKKIVANERAVNPFILLTLSDDIFLHKKSSEIYVESKYPLNPVLGATLKLSGNQKIRIGYFSADFRNHAVSILTAELFELHDKNKFEIIAFSFGADDKSSMRLRLSQAFNQFIDVSGMSDLDIAKLSREMCVDIAVDLGGHTADGRTGIFAYRAAPIQISYLGYLGTMGAEYFDYLFADNIIIPEYLQHFYAEKIAYLPSYQVNDRKRVISDKQFTRAELALPKTGFIFCCFNNNYKILPVTFDSWMRILKAVDGSVLFLYADNQWAESNLKKEAEARGIDSSRLVFGARIPNHEYLARYQSCNLFLDTFPYNAGTTASDALWAGLPILTLTGKSFASRMAASLLSAIGLPELITSTQQEYEALAIELALNPKKLSDIKLKLVNNRLTALLFDTPLFAKNLEAAYLTMHEKYQADL
jgi:protein O-GlcNAc transferase